MKLLFMTFYTLSTLLGLLLYKFYASDSVMKMVIRFADNFLYALLRTISLWPSRSVNERYSSYFYYTPKNVQTQKGPKITLPSLPGCIASVLAVLQCFMPTM
ncbi:MAG: hypothetical protein RL538_658 [Candidatus Parcubacteria bacterium]|jgi:hypothetical protein